MSTIPISVAKDDFNVYVLPHLSVARRGLVCKIELHKVFNYILYREHTGCQWHQLPIAPDPNEPEKKKSVGRRFTTIFASGVGMETLKRYGKKAL
jgi:hypothetical protein